MACDAINGDGDLSAGQKSSVWIRVDDLERCMLGNLFLIRKEVSTHSVAMLLANLIFLDNGCQG